MDCLYFWSLSVLITQPQVRHKVGDKATVVNSLFLQKLVSSLKKTEKGEAVASAGEGDMSVFNMSGNLWFSCSAETTT